VGIDTGSFVSPPGSIRQTLGATTMEIRLGTVKNTPTGISVDLGDELTTERHQTFLDSLSEIHDLEASRRLFEITFLNKNDFVDTFNTLHTLIFACKLKILPEGKAKRVQFSKAL